MRIFRQLPSESDRQACAVAVGNFDGVHLGHQALLKHVVEVSKARNLIPAVLTFDPHPREYLGFEPLSRISTLRDRVSYIASCGIERIYLLSFDQIACLSPMQFAKNILADGLNCKWVTVGPDFRFGSHRQGHLHTLELLGQTLGFEACCTTQVEYSNTRISSSRIRTALAAGDIKGASNLLGRPYVISGHVTHGMELGRKLDFPTLNILLNRHSPNAKMAIHGVYCVRIRNLDETGRIYNGVANVGTKPSVSANRRWSLETNVFDWSGDAYGRIVTVEIVSKLRDERHFESFEALKTQIEADVKKSRAFFSSL